MIIDKLQLVDGTSYIDNNSVIVIFIPKVLLLNVFESVKTLHDPHLGLLQTEFKCLLQDIGNQLFWS